MHQLGGRGEPLVMAHAAGFHSLVFAPLAVVEGLGLDRPSAFGHSGPPLDTLAPEARQAYVDHGFADVGEAGDGGVRLKCRPEVEAVVYEMATAHDAWARWGEVACAVMVAGGKAGR